MKKSIIIVLLIISIFSLTSCKKDDKVQKTSDKLNVVVSFNPLKEFVSQIGKDKVNVISILPKGADVHDFEPKIKDIQNIAHADLFVYNGLGIEPWADKVIKSANNENLKVIKSTDNIDLIDLGNGTYDPHTWLSLLNAKQECENIKNALIEIDADNKDYYQKNYDEFAYKIDELYNEYKVKFENISNRNFVTGHAAFGYLCRDFNLNQVSIKGAFAEGEPSAKKMKELVDYCRENNVSTIFMEDLISPEMASTLASEVGAKIVKINTIEIQDDKEESYIDIMKSNLQVIYSNLSSK